MSKAVLMYPPLVHTQAASGSECLKRAYSYGEGVAADGLLA